MKLGGKCKWCGTNREWQVVRTVSGGVVLAELRDGKLSDVKFACPYGPGGRCEAASDVDKQIARAVQDGRL